MSRKFTLIGLLVGLVAAFSAVTANAAMAAPHWNVNGSPLGAGETAAVAEKVELSGASTLTVPGLNITLHCTELNAHNGFIEGPDTGEVESLGFSNCEVEKAPGCQVQSFGAPAGTINTDSVTGRLETIKTAKDGEVTYAMFTPVEAEFVFIEITRKAGGGGCGVSGEYEVEGTAALKVNTGTNATYLEGEASQTLQEASGQTLLFGAKPSFLTATGKLMLAEAGSTVGVGL